MQDALLRPWTGRYGLPDYTAIATEDYLPAFESAMAEHRAEIEAIKANPAPPDFANTVAALEQAGDALSRVAAVFFNKAAADTNAELQAIERTMAPKLSAHRNAILTDPDLWARITAVAEPAPGSEEARVLDLTKRRFRRAGADLGPEARARMAEITMRLAEIGTQFGQTVLRDEQWALTLDDDDALAGLPDFLIEAARAEGKARDSQQPMISLARASVEPFLIFSERRDLREQAWRAWNARGEADNWPLIEETLRLRIERARLLGHPNFAAWKLEHEMAKTPEAVEALLERVWAPARAKAAEEQAALETLAAEHGHNGPLEPWDWRFWAEKERKRLHDLDERALKPYLALDNVIAAAFDVAARLFGLSFRPVEGATLAHPDARAWEVHQGERFLGLFIGDYYARPSKRSGAWASGLQSQEKLRERRPIVLNTCNFAKGDPALLSWDDARTLFHEFGHALHMLLSDVTYPSISGTGVARDFVELPSQLYEHWLGVPAILEAHARHIETGEVIPAALVEKIRAAETFGQGYQTVSYLGSALVDLAMHRLEDATGLDAKAQEAATLAEIGMPKAVGMRHRTPHFLHVFAGDGYSAGYYSYMWSEVMDADAFAAFEETGDVFDRGLAAKLVEHVLSVGGSVEADAAYIGFRGRLPGVEALLKGRGLAA
ncbi:MAG: M3 family metallopeptidase [Pseudomonadota bacterium]